MPRGKKKVVGMEAEQSIEERLLALQSEIRGLALEAVKPYIEKLKHEISSAVSAIRDKEGRVAKVETALKETEERVEKIGSRSSATGKEVIKMIDQVGALESGWKIQADALSSHQRSIDAAHEAIVKSNNHREKFEIDARGRMIMLERKVSLARLEKGEIEKELRRFRFEAWYWTILASATFGIALGLLSAISSKAL